uniref:Doublecortin domain-containing protein n=1 Tax=Knipowitschia caucasica TaxID=637954 RepID=A0AAV2JH87_KNICA
MKPGPLPEAKTITVYRNGDGFFVGRRVVVSARFSSLDVLLDHLSSVRSGAGTGAGVQFGAVRKLFSLRGLRLRRLQQLEAGGSYSEITAKTPQMRLNVQILPVVQNQSQSQASSRWGKTKDGTCTIHVFRNGEVLFPPVRVRIPKYTLKSWDNVLAMVAEKVRLRTGAVQRLCTVEGRPLSSPAQLRNQQHYVAVGAERFKALPYDQRLYNRPLSNKNSSYGFGRQSKTQNSLVPVHLSREYGNTSLQTGAAERRQPGASSFLGGSVFAPQRRRSEIAGAAEVKEEQLTFMPIDQTEPKTLGEDRVLSCVQGPACLHIHLNVTDHVQSVALAAPKIHK